MRACQQEQAIEAKREPFVVLDYRLSVGGAGLNQAMDIRASKAKTFRSAGWLNRKFTV